VTFSPVVLPGSLVQVADYPAGASFGPRSLADYEFVWVLQGSAVWTVHQTGPTGDLVSSSERPLRPGTLALAHAVTVDSYHWDPARVSTHAYVHFQLAEPWRTTPEADWPDTRSLATSPVLSGICDYLLELGRMPGSAAQDRSDQLLGLLLDLFVTGPLGEPEPSLHPSVQATMECAHRAWSVEGPRIMSADELAAAANVSPGHLFRVFRGEYGCGPARALELIRLARSAVALQRSNASLAEIARRAGFTNAYHFSRRFAQAYGMPPGAYRGLGLGPDPLQPVREQGLLPFAAPLMSSV
jgi:AraC family transcriptional regulator